MKARIGTPFVFTSLIFLGFQAISPNIASAVTTDCTLAGGTQCKTIFSYTGAMQTWQVPAGVSSINFDVLGAAGGAGGGSHGVGGLGGRDTGTVTVTPGSTLYLFVGGVGPSAQASGGGGFNGGGGTNSLTANYGGAGGGASDIRTSVDTSTRIIVAGGGGGASGFCNYNGGAGGGLTGANGTGSCYNASAIGTGGTQSAGGSNSFSSPPSAQSVKSGGLGFGGKGYGYNDGGGGGGGGYYGGGGGIVEAGGGGSSYVDITKVSNYNLIRGDSTATGNGLITFIYNPPQPSSVTISFNPPGTNLVYRSTAEIDATVSTPGNLTFYANGKPIPTCRVVSNNICYWKPSFHGSVTIYAVLVPASGAYASSQSNFLRAGISLRAGYR